MRLITLKIYRAFPELDRFPDERCVEYVRLAARRRWFTGVLLAPIVAMIVVVGGLLAAVLLVALLERLIPRWLPWLAMAGLVTMCSFGVSASLGLLVRDLWLRWAIRGQLSGTRCPTCRYSMLGLRITGGSVTCPECGKSTALADHGLTPKDLLAEEVAVSASSVQPGRARADT